MNEYSKKDNYVIEVVKTEPAIAEKILPAVQYEYKFLLEQRENITKQRDEMIALKQTELDEVNLLISEADKLGIVVKESTEESVKNVSL